MACCPSTIVTKKRVFSALTVLLGIQLFWCGAVLARRIDVISIDDPITPVIAEYIIKSIKESEQGSCECIVIQIDTPGGLDLSMREIIKEMLASSVPVVVYVAPSGARAASAGAIIVLAAHVAAMAPGTNIGAASPVSLGGGKMDDVMKKKVENDAAAYVESLAVKRGRNKEWAIKAVRESVSIGEQEALRLNVVDIVSSDISAMLRDIDGREIETASGRIKLQTSGCTLTYKEMGFRENILKALANPNIAYILLLLGLAGLYFELSNPGAIFPGAIGGIALILSFYALQSLSANYAGVLLILLGAVLFIIELKVASYGLLSVGGIIAITLGSLMLFQSPVPYLRLSLAVLIPSVAILSLFFLGVIGLVLKAQRRRTDTGAEGLIGMVGEAISNIDPFGKIFVHGEYWNARSAMSIAKGSRVRVTAMEGMCLTVELIE